MVSFRRPALFIQEWIQPALCGQFREFAFLEEEASAGAGVSLKVADGWLHEDDDAVRRELCSELCHQRAVEIVEAQDELPRSGWEGVSLEISAKGGELDVSRRRLVTGDIQGSRRDVDQCHREALPGQPQGMATRAARHIERFSALGQIGLVRGEQLGWLGGKEPAPGVDAIPFLAFFS